MLIHSTSLNWLTRHFKGYRCPIVLIAESLIQCDAYYDWNIGSISQIDDSEIFNERGIIVISHNVTLPEETLILHEFRHSLQFELNGFWDVPDYVNGESLEEYNSQSVYEKDARLFQYALGFCDHVADFFSTPKFSRSDMLSLPTPKFLESIANLQA
jgi:hypothetical protein